MAKHAGVAFKDIAVIVPSSASALPEASHTCIGVLSSGLTSLICSVHLPQLFAAGYAADPTVPEAKLELAKSFLLQPPIH